MTLHIRALRPPLSDPCRGGASRIPALLARDRLSFPSIGPAAEFRLLPAPSETGVLLVGDRRESGAGPERAGSCGLVLGPVMRLASGQWAGGGGRGRLGGKRTGSGAAGPGGESGGRAEPRRAGDAFRIAFPLCLRSPSSPPWRPQIKRHIAYLAERAP